jgi:predicted dehydrogenase
MVEQSGNNPGERSQWVRRRPFLAGAAAFPLTALLPKIARAAEAPPKKYRVGVIGHTGRGDYGHGLDTVWRDIPQTEIVGVADPNPAGLAKAVQRLMAPKGYEDYHKMLDELKPDLVSIGVQYIDQHRDMVVAAAERGVRGIYMEKPLCRTLEEADQMVAACRKHKVKLAMAQQSLYVPKMKVIQDIIRSGKLGRVLELRGRGKEDARGGGLDLWVLGKRTLTVMQALAGNPVSCLGTVLQDKRPLGKQDVRDSEAYGIGPLAGDEVHAMYRFSSGVTGYFDSIRNAGAPSPWRHGLQILGSEGALHWYSTEDFMSPAHFLPDPLWDPGRSGKQWIPVSSAGIGVPEPLKDEWAGHHGGNVLAVKDLIAAIEEDRQPLANLEEARINLEMIVAVFESQRTGGLVSFPLKNRANPLTML